MATIKDVAELAGVAPSTVSKYLNGGCVRGQNSQAIANAIEALNYRVNSFARNLKSPHNHSIGILLPSLLVAFWGQMITPLDKTLRSHGYHSLISCYNGDHGLERDKLQFLLNTGIDGLIYIPENLTAEEFESITAHCGIPVVLLDRTISGVSCDTILTNNNEISYQAVSHLIETGHDRIGIITGPTSVFTSKERLVGYLRALSDHGITYDDTLVVIGDISFTTGYHGLISLMDLPTPPTAILSANYDMTIGLITAAKERRVRIPEQVALFGYDCVEFCRSMTPPIPVVQQPDAEMGRIAANYIIERLNGSKIPPRNTCLDCNLIL